MAFAATMVCLAKGKAKTMPIKLLSSAGTGYFYTTRKNIRTVPQKLTLRKYDPVDLFSTRRERVEAAIRRLLDNPQNNRRVFVDEASVFQGEDGSDRAAAGAGGVESRCRCFRMTLNKGDCKLWTCLSELRQPSFDASSRRRKMPAVLDEDTWLYKSAGAAAAEDLRRCVGADAWI